MYIHICIYTDTFLCPIVTQVSAEHIYTIFKLSQYFAQSMCIRHTVLRVIQIQNTKVSGWKRAGTKTLFIFSKITFEFHNSRTFTQICDIMSCIWSFVF